MRLAALYDIHGNLPALEAVLAEVQRAGVDRVVVGGDVLPGPMPAETLARLRELDVPVDFIAGNGEREVLASVQGRTSERAPEPFREGIRWNGAELSHQDHTDLGRWPLTLALDLPARGRVLFCHATPRSDEEIFTRVTSDARLRPVFADIDARLVVCGHTHMQFDRTLDGRRIVNAGSVGMPFGEPGAYWLLLGDAVELRRTTYDLQEAVRLIRATSYPAADAFVTGYLIQPPSAAQMLEVFSRAELA